MSQSPLILVHSSDATEDAHVAAAISARHPELTVLTAGTREEVTALLPEAEIVFAWAFPVDLLPLGRSLRWYQMMGAGVEPLAGAREHLRGVVVTNIRGVFGPAMAEYALTYMLAHVQGVRGVLERQAAREWVPFTPERLAGATVGIAGLGSIGLEVAGRCAALGMRVIGLRREPVPLEAPDVEVVYTVAEIERFLPECDFLVLVLPNTPETTGLLSRARLQLLKPGCFLVSMGRGNVFQLEDLMAVLDEGQLGGAVIDVFPEEPLPAEHPLWGYPNVVVTPHISGVNRPEEVVAVFLDNLERYLSGQPLRNVVDLARGY